MVVLDKTNCTGCFACYSICHQHCIAMEQNTEGFLYPIINEEKCNKCKLCEKVCPLVENKDGSKPLHIYAAKNNNEEVRTESSSGGIFSLLAEHVIHEGGAVFGSRFNDSWEVIHDYTEIVEGLVAFRGSKYVQSRIGDMYKFAEKFLLSGRQVLFSGTPCQIAGLKYFLQNDYDNLITVDFVCHGVPSPLVWRKYLSEICNGLDYSPTPSIVISNIKFRDKLYGWKKYCFSFHYSLSEVDEKTFIFMENKFSNVFMRGFFHNLYLRISCYDCRAKSFKSGSDITIGDYWGIQRILPEFDDDKGISLVMINTEKGKRIYGLLNRDERETTYAEALIGNSPIEKSVQLTQKRSMFFDKWNDVSMIYLINKLTTASFKSRLKNLILLIFCKLGLLSIIKSLLKKQR